jgi:hypothetical protein
MLLPYRGWFGRTLRLVALSATDRYHNERLERALDDPGAKADERTES